MVQEARIDRLMKLVPFAGTVLYSCFIFILCHHLHATGRVRSQENLVMLLLVLNFPAHVTTNQRRSMNTTSSIGNFRDEY